MSQSPTPSAASGGGGDWRLEVQQSARNKQVREIAKVLASLEPGASATSKLRLAMQFEDTVFKGAESLADYQKKLTKRLKKLQKNYVATHQSAAATEKQRRMDHLRTAHGESIRYVLKHAVKAVHEMKARHGEEKGRQLEQHLEAAKVWALDLGLLAQNQFKPKYDLADDQLDRLQSNIERRLENVRAHVVKLADPERFFDETLTKAEDDCHGATAQLLSVEMKRRYLQLLKSNLHNPQAMLQEALDTLANKTAPSTLSTTTTTREDEKAALVHLERMKAASSAFLAFMALGPVDDKSQVAPPGTLKKMHAAALEGTEFVAAVMKEYRKRSKEPDVSLQDAWMKPLEYHKEASSEAAAAPTAILPLRSRLLLTAGRKTPPNLLVELQRKGAKLVRPPPRGQGSHLILEFEQAFVMTVYLVPLWVELRAYQKSPVATTMTTTSATTLVPLHFGLTPDPNELPPEGADPSTTTKELTVWNVKGDYQSLGHVVEERLRDASVQATHVMRQCFAASVKDHAKDDFELELLEGQALRDFLQLARTTYLPQWKDLPTLAANANTAAAAPATALTGTTPITAITL